MTTLPRIRKFPKIIRTSGSFSEAEARYAAYTLGYSKGYSDGKATSLDLYRAAVDAAYNDGFSAGETSQHMELSQLDGSK